MIQQIVYGVIGMIFGLVVTLKTHEIVNITGRIRWAEKTFGGAGTYSFMRALGVFLIFFFFLYMIGMVGVVYKEIVDFLSSILGAV